MISAYERFLGGALADAVLEPTGSVGLLGAVGFVMRPDCTLFMGDRVVAIALLVASEPLGGLEGICVEGRRSRGFDVVDGIEDVVGDVEDPEADSLGALLISLLISSSALRLGMGAGRAAMAGFGFGAGGFSPVICARRSPIAMLSTRCRQPRCVLISRCEPRASPAAMIFGVMESCRYRASKIRWR
jgi:hypothetical protein